MADYKEKITLDFVNDLAPNIFAFFFTWPVVFRRLCKVISELVTSTIGSKFEKIQRNFLVSSLCPTLIMIGAENEFLIRG